MLDRHKSAVGRAVDGVKAPIRGADFLLRHPTLMRYAMAPFLLSVLILSFFLWISVSYLLLPFHDKLVAWLHLAGWLKLVLEVVLWPAALLLYLILASFGFVAIANLLAGPFNERLSLRTEELQTGKSESEVMGLREALKQFGRSLAMEAKKIGFFLLIQLLLLSIWVVPVVGWMAHAVLAGLVTVWFLATEYLDYPMERRKMGYRTRLLFAWSHRYEILGFGAGIGAWLMIPVLGFTALPVSVVGGTLLYLRITEN